MVYLIFNSNLSIVNEKIIFHVGGKQNYPLQEQVLKDGYPFYRAKVGVLWLNRARNSSLLRIIAGKDKKFQEIDGF